MQARYYDPVIGRFYSNDPVGFSPNNIHSFGRYTYGNNNPYRYTDPDGNTSKSIFDSLDKTFAKLNPFSSSSPLPNGRGENIKTSVPISVKSKAAAGELIKTTARVSEAVSLVNKPAGVVNTVAEVANIVVNSENKLADSVGLVVSQVAGNKAGNAVGGFLKNNGVEGKVNEVISNGASQEAGNVAKDLTKEIME